MAQEPRGIKLRAGDYMDLPVIYRNNVTVGDVATPANIEALPEVLDLEHRLFIADNLLHLQVIMPAGVTGYDVEVWGTVDESITIAGLGAERWSKIYSETTLTSSRIISLDKVIPGKVKVLLTNVAGTIGAPGFKILAQMRQ